MKEFLHLVGELMNQLDLKCEYCENTIISMKVAYEKLSKEEKQKSLALLDELLQEDYHSYFFIMSTLLKELKEEEIAFYIEKMLGSDKVPLWERIHIMYQLRATLFSTLIIKNETKEFWKQKAIYEKILQNIETEIQAEYSYISWERREKKIVIIVNQILNNLHAPTRKLISIYKYFKELGYDVLVYVSHYSGKNEENTLWYQRIMFSNQMPSTSPFLLSIGDGEEILGYNLMLQSENYLQEIRKTMDLIYGEHAQFVFELGERTILAGLCHSFTTVVTMGCTKQIPITNAPVIARYFEYSKEEEKLYQQCMEDTQIIIDVKHVESDFLRSDKSETKSDKRRKLEIKEEQFVLIIAGNRLGSELTESFLEILSKILEQSKNLVVMFIGNLQAGLIEKITNSFCIEQIHFLGFRADFQDVISAGDLFLNPPRQGGGTGAAYAGVEGIPVVTLDHCDVAATAGEEFICQSIEEMPSLVWKYYSDKEFYQKQKEIIKNRIQKLLETDGLENFRKLCDFIQQITLEKEKENET